jgi:hypothetical protein
VTLFKHVPHAHIEHRRKQGPVKVADVRAVAPPGAGRLRRAVIRFNTRAAVVVTRAIGTMWCAYAFTALALYGLPAALHGGPAGFVQWASSQFIQLVLLPIIIVGAAVLAEVTDRTNKRQFDDVEAILHGQDQQAAHLGAQDEKIVAVLDRLDTGTDGGIKAVLDAIEGLPAAIAKAAATLAAAKPGGKAR